MNNEELDMKEINRDACSISGLILGILSIIMAFIYSPVSFICGAVSIVLLLIGFSSFGIVKNRCKIGLLITIVGLSLSSYFTLNQVMASEVEYDNSLSQLTADENAEYKKLTYFGWQEQTNYGNSLFVLKDDGTYDWYEDKNNLDDNYVSGVYTIKLGINDDSGYLYKDNSFYYYQLLLTHLKVVSKKSNLDISDKQDMYTFGLDANSKSVSCLENMVTGNTSCFNKIDGTEKY